MKDIKKYTISFYTYRISISYCFSLLSLTTSFNVVANPAKPCNSLGMMIFVASPLDNVSNA